MASVDAKLRWKIRTLQDALRSEREKYREKEDAIHAELDALLGGEPGIGAMLKQIEAHYDELWRVRYSTPYVWNFARDVPQLKRLIKALGVEQLELRMGSYLKNSDPFYLKSKHSFAVFVASINSHAVEPSRQRDEPCTHEPRCPGTWQHVRLLEAEASGDEQLIATCRKFNVGVNA